jgi:exopolysaccharide biosynthesis polyprenyl glycosylphosphotransferase
MFFEPRPQRRRPQLRLSERRYLLRLGDTAASLIAVLIALFIWTRVDRRLPYTLEFVFTQLHWMIILPGLWLLLASANDFYDLQVATRRETAVTRLVVITLQLLLVYLVIFFLSPRTSLPRLFILYYGAACFVLIFLWRVLQPSLFGFATERRHALIVGADWGAEVIVPAIQEHALQQYRLVGVIDGTAHAGQQIAGLPVLGAGAEMLDVARSNGVSELIVATPCELSGELFQGVMDCYQQGISIVPMALLYERLTGRVPVEHVGKDWAIVLPIETASIFDPYPMIKRLIDIVLSLFGLIVFALCLPLIALVIYVDSPGPIFFRQVRVGQGGALFKVVKLRSMIPNAEAATGAVFAGKNDSRITRVGHFLRKSRLDEVPQLWNVLVGEMSLIGPRPERPEFIDKLTSHIPFYRARLAVKPGVTGWAQVKFIYVETIADHLTKLQYDLYYVRHQSVLLDLQIMLRTAGKMLRLTGQ